MEMLGVGRSGGRMDGRILGVGINGGKVDRGKCIVNAFVICRMMDVKWKHIFWVYDRVGDGKWT
jgi:hypothetical protein